MLEGQLVRCKQTFTRKSPWFEMRTLSCRSIVPDLGIWEQEIDNTLSHLHGQRIVKDFECPRSVFIAQRSGALRDFNSIAGIDPFALVELAFEQGWQPIHNIPLAGEGEFIVLTLTGLIRPAKNRKTERTFRRSDKYGPARTSVVSVETGIYLAAIAWK